MRRASFRPGGAIRAVLGGQVRRLGLAAALLCASCAGPAVAPVDTARLSPGAFGAARDPDMAAIRQASDVFASESRSYGRPGDAARAAAAVDYLGGALNTSPRWTCLSDVARTQILEARSELRRVLGVAPGTPSQVVVDDLLRAADAVADNDQAAAERALSPPAFTAPPAQTLRLLGNLPYMQAVTVGTMRVSAEASPGSLDGACFAQT